MNIDETIKTALRYQQQGNLEQAEQLYREILEFQPENVGAYNYLGNILQEKGNFDEATSCYKRAIMIDPDYAGSYYNLGKALHEKGEIDNAIIYYQKAIEINPYFFGSYTNLGNIFHKKGQLNEAIIYYLKAVELNQDFWGTYFNLGSALQENGKFDEAIMCYQRVIYLNPNHIRSYINLGNLFKKNENVDKAIACYQKAIELNSNNLDVYDLLGRACHDAGQLDKALIYYQKALDINPKLAYLYHNAGFILVKMGRFDEAISYFDKAIDINSNADTYSNLGFALQLKGQLNKAIICYKKAIDIEPNDAFAHWNMSLVHLLLGNFEEGWREYEWRWRLKGSNERSFSQELWDGSSLKGKRLFIYAEQGIGEEIMFASCFPDVIEKAESCIIECDKRLVPIFTRSFPGTRIIERLNTDYNIAAASLSFDNVIAMASLPLYLRSSLSNFPSRESYLIPNPDQSDIWSKRFNQLGEGLKIGISWRGGREAYITQIRSMELTQWAEILSIPEIYFINLQYGAVTEELQQLHDTLGITIHNWEDADPLKDLDNFAAEISSLDLVISIDNSTVHMAGALGVPVWTLLSFAHDWRWMLNRQDTPWYPTMRLFCQPSPKDWKSVVAEVKDDLLQVLKKEKPLIA